MKVGLDEMILPTTYPRLIITLQNNYVGDVFSSDGFDLISIAVVNDLAESFNL